MEVKRVDLQPGAAVEIEAEDDLVIQGMDEAVLEIEGVAEEHVTVTQEAGKVLLKLAAEAKVRVGRNVPVTLNRVEGSLTVNGLQAELQGSHLQNDVALNQVGEVRLADVKGGVRANAAAKVELDRIEDDVLLSKVGYVQLTSVEGDVSINAGGDVRAQGYIGGDVLLRQVNAVELGEVGGDLNVITAAAVSAERVEGDVSIRSAAGEVRLNKVEGDVTLRGVGGAVEAGRVDGDLTARDLRGDVMVTRVEGDITLYVAFQEGHRYSLTCEDDLVVNFPEGTAARFTIVAPRWTVPSGEAFQVESQEEGRVVVRVGQGGPDVSLTSDAEVVLGGMAGDWDRSVHEFSVRMEKWGEEFGQQMADWGEQLRERMKQTDWERIGREVEEATARVAQLVETRLQEIDVEEMRRRAEEMASQVEKKVKEVDWERIGRKVERATAQGMERMQAGLQRLQERLQAMEGRQQERHARRQKRGERWQGHAVEVTISDPTAEAHPAPVMEPTDEERMAVLRLVEEGRLTAEEADALLEALGDYTP